MVKILRSHLFPVYKLGQEIIQPGNMWDIILEKTKGCDGTVDRISD